MKYAEKYSTSQKYNRSRLYIYFWQAHWNGSVESMACRSRRPHSHPNQHTEAEMKLIRDVRRRNPQLGLVELWHRLKQRSYTRRPESLFRIMRRLWIFPQEKKKKAYTPKPYQQMTPPGERIQVDVKVVPTAASLTQSCACSSTPPLTSSPGSASWPPEQSTYSSADFLKQLVKWYARRDIRVECVQTDNRFEFTRPCLKNGKTPKRRIFFRCAALKILEIHKVFLRIFALPSKKISRRRAFRPLSNKA